MSDIVERLREYADDDHERGCAGRCYDCSCGYDSKRDPLLNEAADEIERLKAALRLWGLIDWDNMAEHDQALLDEAINGTRAALKEDGDD